MYPKYVYHYTKLNILIEKILYEGTLKFGLISETNDPKETKFASLPTSIDINQKMNQSHNNKLQQFAADINKEIKVLCVSMDDPKQERELNIKGWGKSRMWAQYAENHKGVCIKINTNKLINEFTKSASDREIFHFNKVKYENHPWGGGILYPPNTEILNLESERNKIIYTLFERYSIKSRDWESESEFRFFIHEKSHEPFYLKIDNLFETIYLGEGVHEAYHSSLVDLCKKFKVSLRGINWLNGIARRDDYYLYIPD